MSSQAGPSATKLTGSRPGVLDPSQRTRLLRHPDSTLSFAAFDPLTASAHRDVPDLRKLSLNEELYRPKRVVVERSPDGECLWRFVPRARMDNGVVDEGVWPRVIEICGELVECSQDQWDIYKLDPEYECYVQAPPKLSTITRVIPKSVVTHLESSPVNKRPLETPSPGTTMPRTKMKSQSQNHNRHQKARDLSGFTSSEEDDEDEVEEMIIDDGIGRGRAKSAGLASLERSKRLREEIDKNRRLRREKIAKAAEAKYGQNGTGANAGENMFNFAQAGDCGSPESPGKRKVSSLFNPLSQGTDSPMDDDGKQSKRSRRTASPTSVRRDILEKHLQRERRKKEKWDNKLDEWRKNRYKEFMDEVLAEVPEFTTSKEEEEVEEEGHHVYVDQEATRQAAIEESRRKLADLEADRPLWEQHAKRRETLEKQEEDARRAKREQQLRQKAEGEREAKREKEELEARLREEEAHRKREHTVKREWERRQRQQRWSTGPWTTQRALERYKTLCESFDGTKFSLDEPLMFDLVPWPVLQSPISLTVEDVDWKAVEVFFEEIKPHMRTQDFKMFVEKSQRRFHPDRWRSRGLLKSITDDAERGCMEVAANTVAQALTPLWKEIKAL